MFPLFLLAFPPWALCSLSVLSYPVSVLSLYLYLFSSLNSLCFLLIFSLVSVYCLFMYPFCLSLFLLVSSPFSPVLLSSSFLCFLEVFSLFSSCLLLLCVLRLSSIRPFLNYLFFLLFSLLICCSLLVPLFFFFVLSVLFSSSLWSLLVPPCLFLLSPFSSFPNQFSSRPPCLSLSSLLSLLVASCPLLFSPCLLSAVSFFFSVLSF
jgi:hypothetical protein